MNVRTQQTAGVNVGSVDGQQFPSQEQDTSDDVSASSSIDTDVKHYRIYWHPESGAGGFTASQLDQLVRQIADSGNTCSILVNSKLIKHTENLRCLERIRHLVIECSSLRSGNVHWSRLMDFYKVFTTGHPALRANAAVVVDYLYLADETAPDVSYIPQATSRALLLSKDMPDYIEAALRNLSQLGVKNPVMQMPVDLTANEEEPAEVVAAKQRQVARMVLDSALRHMSEFSSTAVAQLVMQISLQQINTQMTPLNTLPRLADVDSDDDETVILHIPANIATSEPIRIPAAASVSEQSGASASATVSPESTPPNSTVITAKKLSLTPERVAATDTDTSDIDSDMGDDVMSGQTSYRATQARRN